MSIRAQHQLGIVEIEDSYVRILRHESNGWTDKALRLNDDSPWSQLKTELPSFFPAGSGLIFVFQSRCGIKMFNFPTSLSKTEILGNLRIKREEHFGSREDYLLSLRMGNQIDQKNREVYVSYMPRSLCESAQELCRELGFSLQRVVTGFDALLGAVARQLGRNISDTVILVSFGYSQVHLAAWRGGELVMVRSLLTGSIKELGNGIFTSFSINQADLMKILSESMEVPSAVTDSITLNRQEVMTHIGTLFAGLRGRKLLSDNPTMFVCQPVVEEPQLASMIAERFSANVIQLNSLSPEESAAGIDPARWGWLLGATMPSAPNILPRQSYRAKHLAVSSNVAVFGLILMCITPFVLLRLFKAEAALESATLSERNQTYRLISELNRSNQSLKNEVDTIEKGVTADIAQRGNMTELVRYLSENLPPLTRLENLEINNKDGKVKIFGKSVDTESSLRYLDRVKSSPMLANVEISFDSPGGMVVSFAITGQLPKKG